MTTLTNDRRLVYPEDQVTATMADENLDIDFGNKGLMSKGDGFDLIRPSKKEMVRVNLLTDVVGMKGTWLHFVKGKGVIRCQSRHDDLGNIIGLPALCCRKLNQDDEQQSQFAAAVLAFVYKNASPIDGKYPMPPNPAPPIEWELGWVKLSRSGYRRVSNLRQEDQLGHEFDMTISLKTGELKGGYEYNVIASKARFRQNPELVAEVMETAESFKDGKKLTRKLGRVVSDLELMAMLEESAGANSAANANVDDINNL